MAISAGLGTYRKRRGSMMAELAVCIPVLILVVFAGFELAYFVSRKADLNNAARVAARTASMADTSYNDVIDAVRQQMAITNIADSAWTLELSPSDPDAALPGTPVSATIRADYSELGLGLLGSWVSMPTELESSAVMRKEGSQ